MKPCPLKDNSGISIRANRLNSSDFWTLSDLLTTYTTSWATLKDAYWTFVTPALWSKTAKNKDCSTRPLARLFARSMYHSLVCFLQTARFARALRCAHLFARSLISLTFELVGKLLIGLLFFLCFFLFSTIVGRRVERGQHAALIFPIQDV